MLINEKEAENRPHVFKMGKIITEYEMMSLADETFREKI